MHNTITYPDKSCQPRCYIVALNLVSEKAELTFLDALGLSYKPVEGRHNNEKERAYLIVLDDCREFTKSPDHSIINHITKTCGQECALYLDNQRQAYFLYPDGRLELQGTFKTTSKQFALSEIGYTFDASTGLYYIISPVSTKNNIVNPALHGQYCHCDDCIEEKTNF